MGSFIILAATPSIRLTLEHQLRSKGATVYGTDSLHDALYRASEVDLPIVLLEMAEFDDLTTIQTFTRLASRPRVLAIAEGFHSLWHQLLIAAGADGVLDWNPDSSELPEGLRLLVASDT